MKSLLKSTENTFWPNQYSHRYNPIAHHQTMREIVTALDNEVDYLFCATSTCGTIRGCAEYLRDHDLSTRIFAVDAVGSVIFGGVGGKRLIPGHGAAVRPRSISLMLPSIVSTSPILIVLSDAAVSCVTKRFSLVVHPAQC